MNEPQPAVFHSEYPKPVLAWFRSIVPELKTVMSGMQQIDRPDTGRNILAASRFVVLSPRSVLFWLTPIPANGSDPLIIPACADIPMARDSNVPTSKPRCILML